MTAYLPAALTNAAVASLLALGAIAVCRAWRNPFVNRGVWLAVLLKFVVPPLVLLPLFDLPVLRDEAPPQSPAAQPSEPQQPLEAIEADAHLATTAPDFSDGDARDVEIAASAVERVEPNAVDAASPRAATPSGVSPPSPVPPSGRLLVLFVYLWLAGAAAIVALAIFRIACFHVATVRQRIAPHRWQRRARQLADQAGLAARPIVRLTAGRTPPLVWRIGRRAHILLPAQLVAQLSTAEVDAILAHEITHLRRRDDRLRWFELAVVGAYWWCPLAWLARRRLHEAEERCCDADALRTFPAIAAHYGRALLATLDFVAPAPRLALAGTAFMDRGSLLRRFEMITSRRLPAPPTRRTRTLLLVACGALLVTTPIARSVETTPDAREEDVAPQQDQTVTIQLPDGALVEGRMTTKKDGRVVVVMPSATIAEPKPSDDKSTPAQTSPALAQTSSEPADETAVATADASAATAGQGLSDHSVGVFLSHVGKVVKGRWRVDGKSVYFVPDDPKIDEVRFPDNWIQSARRNEASADDGTAETAPPSAPAAGDLQNYINAAAPQVADVQVGEPLNHPAPMAGWRLSDGPTKVTLPDGRVIEGRLRVEGDRIFLVPNDPAAETVEVGDVTDLALEPRFLPKRKAPSTPGEQPDSQPVEGDLPQSWDLKLYECIEYALKSKYDTRNQADNDGNVYLRQQPGEKQLPEEEFRTLASNLARDVEDAYWELYFAYRDLEARHVARDSALATWRRVKTLERAGSVGGEANAEAQTRSQYYLCRAQAETARSNLYRAEQRLRYLIGMAAVDGRLLRPKDEPTGAAQQLDLTKLQESALTNRVELARADRQIEQRKAELAKVQTELAALKAQLADPNNGAAFRGDGTRIRVEAAPGSEVAKYLVTEETVQQAEAKVRHHELLLERERAVRDDLRLEISHQLGDSLRDVDLNYGLLQVNFNRRQAANDEVEAVQTLYEVGQVQVDRLLDAQARQSEAASAYSKTLVDYNRAIMRLHYRSGSLLSQYGYKLPPRE